jgi:hypothetical protein
MITSLLLLKKRGEDLIVIDNSNMKLICQITVALAVVVSFFVLVCSRKPIKRLITALFRLLGLMK